nr:Gag-Pol polyprotein [Tanacetum cinerariifolium]
MFDEYFNTLQSAVSPVPEAVAPITVEIAATPSSTTTDQDVPSLKSSSNVPSSHSPLELIGKWTKDHPLENVIEPKNFKQDMLESSWIKAMQEEIHEFATSLGIGYKNKARLVAQGFWQEEGIEFEE